MNSLIGHIGHAHLEMLFYFSLKKTGSRSDAEELAQEIACEAVVSLGKGVAPVDFDRWLWGVARKRYARWVESKQKQRASFVSLDTVDLAAKLPPASDNPEEEYIRQEQLHLLRRELALLSRAYREILVAYYIEKKRIADIARNLGVPEGTIKRKLHESRRLLKEGMAMARANGQRSYAPENVGFVSSGNHAGSNP